MDTWLKTKGTQVGSFILGFLGVRLKNSSGNLHVRNNGDTGFADAQVKDIIVSNNSTTYDVTVTTNGSQAADYTLTLPVDTGSVGQVLSTNGSGVLSWVSAASTDANWKVETTSVNFGSGSTITAFTLPANAIIDKVMCIVDTAFDGTPTLSVGDSGNNSKFMGSGDNLLTLADRFDVYSQEPATGSPINVEIYYAAGGATVGAARVLCTYAVPA
jgi:hypothetical protein